MTVTYFMAIIVTLILMSFYILNVLSKSLHENESVKLFAKADIIANSASTGQSINVELPNQITQIIAGTGIRAIVVDTSNYVTYDSNKEKPLDGTMFTKDILEAAMLGEKSQSVYKAEDGYNVMSVSVPIKKNGEILGAVYLSETISDIDETISYVTFNMILFSVLISIFVGMLSVGMSFFITSPIDGFIKAAKEISNGNYKMRLKVKGESELAELSKAMNTMCETLENIDETQKKFISDVSHELKTPLASIKLICDSIVDTSQPDIEMIKEFLSDLSNEVDRLTRIVERLLTLSKIDNEEEKVTFTPVDFNVMLNAIMNRLRPNATNKQINLFGEFDTEGVTPILVDYDKIWEAIYNITDNAIKYTPQNGQVKLRLYKNMTDLAISISDSGTGIAPEDRDKIFERFYRLDDSRTRETGGTGLGLAIAKEAVMLHDGRIEVDESEFGGSRFIIYLPQRTGEI